MNDGEHDDWQESIAHYYSEIDYIREMLDPKKRLLESAVLVEKIIKTHFLRSDREKHGLGTLLRMRRKFLGRQLFRQCRLRCRDEKPSFSPHTPPRSN